MFARAATSDPTVTLDRLDERHGLPCCGRNQGVPPLQVRFAVEV
jgi:hypothetical protein